MNNFDICEQIELFHSEFHTRLQACIRANLTGREFDADRDEILSDTYFALWSNWVKNPDLTERFLEYGEGELLNGAFIYARKIANNKICRKLKEHYNAPEFMEDPNILKELDEIPDNGRIDVLTQDSDRDKQLKLLREAIGKLDSTFRVPLELELQGLSPAQIATKLGLKLSTIRVQIFRARVKLRNMLT